MSDPPQVATPTVLSHILYRIRVSIRKAHASAYIWRDPVAGIASGLATNIAGHYAIGKGWLPADMDVPIQAASFGVTFIVSFPLMRQIARSIASIANASLVAIGGGAVTVLAYRPMSDAVFENMPSSAKTSAVFATILLATAGGFLGIMRLVTTPRRPMAAMQFNPASSPEDRWDVANAARHEAGHALVSSVIGLPLWEANVSIVPKGNSGGMTSFIVNTVTVSDLNEMCSLLLRRISMQSAGVLAEREWPTPEASMRRFETQTDRDKACSSMEFVAMMRPGSPNAGNDIYKATWQDMNYGQWRAAIDEASKILLRDPAVPADVFHEIARRRNLDMPCVQAVIDGVLSRDSRGMQNG